MPLPESPDPLATPRDGELDDALAHGIPEDILDEAFVEGSPGDGPPNPDLMDG